MPRFVLLTIGARRALPSRSRRRGSRNAITGVIGGCWWRVYAAGMEGRWCRGIGFGGAVIGGLVSGVCGPGNLGGLFE